MTPAELLDQAADVIEERGHCKSKLEDNDGAVCLMGGMNVVQGGTPFRRRLGFGHEVSTRRKAHEALAAEVCDLKAERMRSCCEPWGGDFSFTIECALIDWNNAEERTQDDVVMALRHAAKRARGGA